MTALGAIVVGLLAYAAFAIVNHYDLTNPLRDGTTHTAGLRFSPDSSPPLCLEDWTVALGGYYWHPVKTPPWGEKSVQGQLHIINSQRVDDGIQGNPVPAATFTARGHTIDLSGGRSPRFGPMMNCSMFGG